MNKTNTRKALNPAYRKHKPLRKDVTYFLGALQNCISAVRLSDENGESEEHIKSHFKDFFTSTFFKEHYINTKDRIDLAVYLGDTPKSDVGIIIEAKKPSNKAEFLTEGNLNRKALQELLLYYLRERVNNENNNVKHLIATNGYEWFLFKAEDFYTYFYKNKALIKEYKSFRDGLKDTSKNELFYNEIAKKYIATVEEEIPFVHLSFAKTNFKKLSDGNLNTLYKIFSNVHLLGHSFGNDSNQLNKSFYNELLHIIGLEEVKNKGKKVIHRKEKKDRDYASLLENAIFHLEDRDYLSKVKSVENTPEKAFNVGLELCLTWINRILFLKLLESQLLTYHNGDKNYKFLNAKFIDDYDELNDLFFSALAKKEDERHPRYKDKYQHIPYLNSSLFERSPIEAEAFEISTLSNDDSEIYSQTVLKDASGKRLKGKLPTLEYLFKFLDAYDFATDGNEGIEDGLENKSLINASVLGLIFEKINGYKEGSFYTPAYITMYMCKETLRRAVVQKFKEQENDQIETFEDLQSYCHRYFKTDDLKRFNSLINSLRICDPAVGSGHFLVSALNELIVIKNELGFLVDAKGLPLRCDIEIVNDELYVLDDNGLMFEYNPNNKESVRIQHTLFHEKQTLIENCLFGVDINPNSVKICRLRLWIELLKNAYYTKENRLQTLPNIDINIKCGNSLISRFSLDDDLKDAFRNKKNPKLKYTFSDYKNAVAEYKEANSKEQKQEVLEIIDEVKFNFQSTLDNKFIDKFQKAQGDLINEQERQNNLKQFGEKIIKKDKDQLKKLKLKAEKALEERDEIVNNAIYHNAFEWRFEFPEVLADDGSYIGFDAVIGNPPYGVSIKGKERVYLVNKINKVPDYEIYYWFIERAHQILKSKGNVSYIIPNTILFNVFAQDYRANLFNNWSINEILDCTDIDIFDEATVRTIIFQFQKEGEHNTLYYRRTNDLESFEQLKNRAVENIDKETVLANNQNWSLIFKLEQATLKLVAKIKENKDLLSQHFEFSQGYIPYRRSDLIKKYGEIEGNKIIEERLWHSEEKLNEEYLPEIFGRELNRYGIVNKSKTSFVKYGKHLAGYVELKYFNQKRLLIREITNPFIIATLLEETYVNDPQLISVIESEKNYGLNYIWAILNSKLATFYHFNSSPKATKGAFPKILVYDIKNFPLPKSIENDRLLNLVNEVIEIKNLNPEADISALDNEIDQMVYKLYGLTDEEIAIVEQSSK